MNIKNKLVRLRKLISVAESEEIAKRQSWQAAQNKHEQNLKQEEQLQWYFSYYADVNVMSVPAALFSNRQHMLNNIRAAQEQQLLETRQINIDLQNEFIKWQNKYFEKRSYEILVKKQQKKLLDQERTNDQINNAELISQIYSVKTS